MKALKLKIAFLSIVVGATSALCAYAKDPPDKVCCPYKNMKEAIDTITARETAQEWQKIHWRTSAATALEDAKKESKPIFVFFVVTQKAPSPKSWVGKQDDTGKT